jgi:hypothetical protein
VIRKWLFTILHWHKCLYRCLDLRVCHLIDVFVYGLVNAVSSAAYVTLNDSIWKEAVLGFRYCPGIYLGGLGITTKTSE